MIPTLISIVSFGILVAEFWTGIAVGGLSGDQMVVERAKQPGPYWCIMAVHTLAGIGVPLLAFLAM